MEILSTSAELTEMKLAISLSKVGQVEAIIKSARRAVGISPKQSGYYWR